MELRLLFIDLKIQTLSIWAYYNHKILKSWAEGKVSEWCYVKRLSMNVHCYLWRERKGAIGYRILAAYKNWKRKGHGFPPKVFRKNSPADLDKWDLFWALDLKNCKVINLWLFKFTKIVVICYSNNRNTHWNREVS